MEIPCLKQEKVSRDLLVVVFLFPESVKINSQVFSPSPRCPLNTEACSIHELPALFRFNSSCLKLQETFFYMCTKVNFAH